MTPVQDTAACARAAGSLMFQAVLDRLMPHFDAIMGLAQVAYARHSYTQAERLHSQALAADISTHFQNLSQELFSAAKEADRDVWEQHNDRFANLTILAVLMLSVTASLVTEGSFNADYEGSIELQVGFVLFTSLGTSCLLVCLAASFRATRNMSQFMSSRSALLSERIDVLAHEGQLSHAMQQAYGAAPMLNGEIPTRQDLAREIFRDVAQAPVNSLAANDPSAAAARFTLPPALMEPPVPRLGFNSLHTHTSPQATAPRSPASARARELATRRVRFADFFYEECRWLETLATATFGLGSIFATVAIAILVHNEFLNASSTRPWWRDPAYIFSGVTAIGLFFAAVIIFHCNPRHRQQRRY